MQLSDIFTVKSHEPKGYMTHPNIGLQWRASLHSADELFRYRICLIMDT